MATLRQDLGPVTAYAYAVSEGYTGTEEEFAEVLANFADSAEQVAADAAQVALDKGVVHDDKEAVDSAEGRVTSAVNTFTTTTAPNAVTAVENAGTAQIGLVEAEGTRQIGLVADKGTEQVGTVSSEGTTQIGLVEAKGAEVIASIPGDYSALQGDIASTYSSSSTYAVGDYVLYSGQLYRCTTAISTAEAWTSAKWTAAVLGDDVSTLKSALGDINALDSDLLKKATWTEGAINFTTGADSWSNLMIRTNYIPLSDLESISISIDASYKYVCALINADKTVVVNSPSWATEGSSIDLSDYPTAGYVRFLLQKTDNTKPDSNNYLHVKYSTNFLNVIDNTLQYGGVTYGALAQELKNTLAYKYNETAEALVFSNTNYLLKKDGTILSYTGDNAVTDYIDCSSWFSFKFSGRQYYDGQCFAFYDSAKHFISSYPNSSSGIHDYNGIVVSIPQNAKYVRVANFTANETVVYISTTYIPASIGYKWHNKKWCCIGDSLTEVNSTATKRYHDYIADHTGITVVNLGVGGTGYMNGGSGSNPFRNRVSSIPIDADVITIFGSFNDLGETRPLGTESDTGTDTIGGCINTTLDDIFTRITLANVGIITPTPWGSAYPLDNESSNQYKYVQLLKDICERRGIPCLDLFHCSQLRPWDSDFKTVAYSNDSTGVHPDENGHKLIAPRFEGFLDTLLFV